MNLSKMNATPQCSYIPPYRPFLADVANWLIQSYSKTPEDLSKLLILLPNRRSCRSLREAFLSSTQGKPLLLPQIQPIGDVDEQVLWLDAYMPQTQVPAPVAPLKREMLLTQLLMQQKKSKHGKKAIHGLGLEQAASLAGDLAFLLDEVAYEGLSFSQLSAIVPEDHSDHWQETLQFLEVISVRWPNILEQEGGIDAADYRMRMLKAVSEIWSNTPPSMPVIAVGIHSTLPPVVSLLKTIAHLPQGHVILPGLDHEIPASQWDALTPTHPQFSLKWMLEYMEIPRTSVAPLDAVSTPRSDARSTVLNTLLQPATATAQWSQAALPIEEGFKNVHVLELQTQQEEAKAVSVLLRETLNTPNKTAALITPNRQLARMVAAQLRRFEIAVDDSGGAPLARQPEACFLRLIAQCAADNATPASLLSMLRHPLAAAGISPIMCDHVSEEIELKLLRGLRLPEGLAALVAAADEAVQQKKSHLREQARDMLHDLAHHAKAFFELMQQEEAQSLEAIMRAHITCAQWLASSEALSGEQRLWHGDSAQQLASIMADVIEHAKLLPAVIPTEYPAFLDMILARSMYRPRYGSHPRIHIYGAMEAQLQQYDCVILSSMNEGDWPATTSADPWMSRPMRAAFGLPEHERQIGRSAHDVMCFANAPEVYFTRAHKVENSPTIASRWLVRLHTLLSGLNPDLRDQIYDATRINSALQWLDTPDEHIDAIQQPKPVPPISARPKAFSVSAVDRWNIDPYAYYAQYILKLRALDPLDMEPGNAHFGQLVHHALELFTIHRNHAWPKNPEDDMREAGKEAFAPMIDRLAVSSFWWPRFNAMIPWLCQNERRISAKNGKSFAEVQGYWSYNYNGVDYSLGGRIDRLETNGAHVSVIDYKTGSLPTKKDLKNGVANQMPLLGLICNLGSLEHEAIPKSEHKTQALEYWKLAGTDDKCAVLEVDNVYIQTAQLRLEGLIQEYSSESKAYIAPHYSAQRYNDYEHLTRRHEWSLV